MFSTKRKSLLLMASVLGSTSSFAAAKEAITGQSAVFCVTERDVREFSNIQYSNEEFLNWVLIGADSISVRSVSKETGEVRLTKFNKPFSSSAPTITGEKACVTLTKQ